MRNLICAFVSPVLLVAGSPLAAQDSGSESAVEMVVSEATGQRALTQSIVVDAPVADVWAAFATEEGYESWAVTNSSMDFRVGGLVESNYAAEFTAGDPANIINQIVAFVPERMLVLRNVKAPAGFASRETLDRLISVFEFTPVSDTATRITIHGMGYSMDEESDQLIEFFQIGNAWSFGQLRKKFAEADE